MIKQVSGYEEFEKELYPVLITLGPYLHRDILLFFKLLRLLKEKVKSTPSMMKGDGGKEMEEMEKIIVDVIFPSLSCSFSNPSLSHSVWEIIKLFPYTTRYRLYSSWQSFSSLSDHPFPPFYLFKAKTEHESRRVMKRLSKENVKQCGRLFGKISHSNPYLVFNVIFENIQAYENLIPAIVDSLKYISALSFDFLSYYILDRVSSPTKQRIKSDGVNVETWLSSIASFVGSFYAKYPNIELLGLLNYISNQLKDGNTVDLIIFSNLLAKMGGVEIFEDYTPDQFDAKAGGDQLKIENFPNQLNGRNLKRPIAKLRDALINSGLIVQLVLLMAQQRIQLIFNSELPHLKVISARYDRCQYTLVQFIEFLHLNVPLESMLTSLPSILQLSKVYHIDSDIIFSFLRPFLPLLYPDPIHIPSSLKDKLFSLPLSLTLPDFYDDEENDNDNNDNDDDGSNIVISSDDKAYGNINDDERMEISDNIIIHPPDRKRGKKVGLIKSIERMIGDPQWVGMAELYTTFWSLTLYDIYVPEDRYNLDIQKQLHLMNNLENNKDVAVSKDQLKKKKESIQLIISNLKDELLKQKENHKQVMEKLTARKDHWLIHCPSRNEIAHYLLQSCIIPRCIFTSIDAIYSTKFIHLLHTLATPNFSTLQYFDKVIKDTSYLIFSCTELEAKRYGQFLAEGLAVLKRWRNEGVYEKECQPLPGFSTSFTNHEKRAVSFKEFLQVNYRWHVALNKAFIKSLESKEYMEIRNTLIVFSKIVNYFPELSKAGANIKKRITKFIETEEREDLQLLAHSYKGQLESKSFISDEEFSHIDTPKQKPPSTSTSSPSLISSSKDLPKPAPPSKLASSSSSALPSKTNKDNKDQPIKEKKEEGQISQASSTLPPQSSSKDISTVTHDRERDRDRDRDRAGDRDRDRDRDGHRDSHRERERDRDRDRDNNNGEYSKDQQISFSNTSSNLNVNKDQRKRESRRDEKSPLPPDTRKGYDRGDRGGDLSGKRLREEERDRQNKKRRTDDDSKKEGRSNNNNNNNNNNGSKLDDKYSSLNQPSNNNINNNNYGNLPDDKKRRTVQRTIDNTKSSRSNYDDKRGGGRR